MHWEMENKEPSPVNLINRCLEIKSYNCLICGKRAGKGNLRSPGEESISAFITALRIRWACNNFDKSEYDVVFDINNNTLKNNDVSIKWHPRWYLTFTTSKDISFFKDNPLRKALAF